MKKTYKILASVLATCCLLFGLFIVTANKPIKEIQTDQAPKPMGPYSQGVIAGQFLFISTGGIDPKTGQIGKTIEEQTLQTLKNVEAVLVASGLTLESVVKTDVY